MWLDEAAAQSKKEAQRIKEEPLEEEPQQEVELVTGESSSDTHPEEDAESEKEKQPVESDTEQPPDDKLEEQPQERGAR